jgi:hypothetical protein
VTAERVEEVAVAACRPRIGRRLIPQVHMIILAWP